MRETKPGKTRRAKLPRTSLSAPSRVSEFCSRIARVHVTGSGEDAGGKRYGLEGLVEDGSR